MQKPGIFLFSKISRATDKFFQVLPNIISTRNQLHLMISSRLTAHHKMSLFFFTITSFFYKFLLQKGCDIMLISSCFIK